MTRYGGLSRQVEGKRLEYRESVEQDLTNDLLEQVRLLSRLFAAVALGVGAIFGHKAERDAHWSDPPNWIADADTDASNSGAP